MSKNTNNGSRRGIGPEIRAIVWAIRHPGMVAMPTVFGTGEVELLTHFGPTTAGSVMTFKQQKSTDGTTYIDSVYAVPLTYTTAAAAGVLDLHMYAERPYTHIRVVATLSSSTGTPVGIYKVEVDSAIPG